MMSDKEFEALKAAHQANFAETVRAHARSNQPVVEPSAKDDKLAYFGGNVNNMKLHESLAVVEQVEEVTAATENDAPKAPKTPKTPTSAPAWKPKA